MAKSMHRDSDMVASSGFVVRLTQWQSSDEGEPMLFVRCLRN